MSDSIKIYNPDTSSEMELHISESKVSAGFPSPAENFSSSSMDLNKELIRNPASTFYARVRGESMIDDGIGDGDLLVIDKSITPYNNCIAVCFIDGEFTLKRFENHGDHGFLIPANKKFKPLKICEDNDFVIWGIVRYIIKKV